MMRKAKETDFQEILQRASLGQITRANARVINHESVEINFNRANYCGNEENPLDDDSI
jgi:hypothetical protein